MEVDARRVQRERMLNELYYLELIITERIFFQAKFEDESIRKVSRIVQFPINKYQTVINFNHVSM